MIAYVIAFKVNQLNDVDTLIINILFFLAVFLFIRRCKLNSLSIYLQDKGRVLVISIIFCIIIIFLCLIIHKHSLSFDVISSIVILSSTGFIVILAINLGKYRIKSVETEAELKVHKMYEHSFETLIDNIRMRQHEFDNHINTIYSQHFVNKTYDELVAAQNSYCKEIEHENHYNKLLSSGNSVMIGFLYGKFLEIEKQKIDLKYKISIKDLNCDIPIHKMIELLSDLINNAVEAIISSSDYNKIYVSIIESDEKIKIEVRNESKQYSFEELQHFFNKGYSRKGENRGLGLFNVRQICTEYNSKVSCENIIVDDNNWISFQVEIVK